MDKTQAQTLRPCKSSIAVRRGGQTHTALFVGFSTQRRQPVLVARIKNETFNVELPDADLVTDSTQEAS